jgi:hypothetical protein
MDISVIKQVISNAIPSNVNISDIDIKEGNGKLTVQLTWQVLKCTGPDLNGLPKIVIDPKPHFGFMDGYVRPFDLNTPIPLVDLEPLPTTYRNKLCAELERSEEEGNRLRLEREAEASRLRARQATNAANAASIRESEDARIIAELQLLPFCRAVIDENPKQVAGYRSGHKGNLGFLLSKLLIKDELRTLYTKVLDIKLISEVLERLLNEEPKAEPLSDIAKRIKEVGNGIPPKEPTVITVPSITNDISTGHSTGIPYYKTNGPVNQEYAKSLRRAGFSAAQADEMAREKPLRVTAEGKAISQIDLKDPKYDRNSVSEERVAQNSHVPAVEQAKATIKKNSFRRPDDGNTIDGYKRVSFNKKPSEVVSEYTAAIKGYEKRFGPELDSRGNKVGFADVVGKRGVSACSTNKRNISDVEIMLMANEKFTRPITDPPPRPAPAKKEEPVKIPPKKEIPPEPSPETPEKNGFKIILSHLKAIKNELKKGLFNG